MQHTIRFVTITMMGVIANMTTGHMLVGLLNLVAAAYLGHSTSRLAKLMHDNSSWDWKGLLVVLIGVVFFFLNVFGVWVEWIR